jgi:3D (Asp-Asp-Asp) domain-containing protein
MSYYDKTPLRGFKMDTNLKCPKWGRNLSLIIVISGILFGFSFPGILNAPQVEADFVQISLPEDLGELAIIEGNSLLPIVDPFNPESQPVRRIRVVITGYSSTEDQTDSDPFITAAGTQVREGIIANNLFPFGTKIKLPELYGEKIFVVEDRMNWKKGYYHIDIWFPSYWEAKEFGAKRTYIEVLES